MSKLSDLFENTDDFNHVLRCSKLRQQGEWEADFLQGLSDRYEIYQMHTYLSEKQYDSLMRIYQRQIDFEKANRGLIDK